MATAISSVDENLSSGLPQVHTEALSLFQYCEVLEAPVSLLLGSCFCCSSRVGVSADTSSIVTDVWSEAPGFF